MIADAFDWIVKNKLIDGSVLIGVMVLAGIVRFVVPLMLSRSPRPDVSAQASAERSGKVQQTITGDVNARGDVDISPRQE